MQKQLSQDVVVARTRFVTSTGVPQDATIPWQLGSANLVQCSSFHARDASLQQRIVPERHFALLQAYGHVLAEYRSAGQVVIHPCRCAERVVLCLSVRLSGSQSVSQSGVLTPSCQHTSVVGRAPRQQGRSSGWPGVPLARTRVTRVVLEGCTRASPNAMVS